MAFFLTEIVKILTETSIILTKIAIILTERRFTLQLKTELAPKNGASSVFHIPIYALTASARALRRFSKLMRSTSDLALYFGNFNN